MLGAPHLVRGLQALADLRPRVEVEASRCSRARGSGCTLCLAQCPVAALRADEEYGAPVVDADACLACGVCVAACPTEALGGVGVSPEALRAAAEGSRGLRVWCANVRTEEPADDGEPPGETRMPERRVACLATLHPEALTAAVATLEPGGVLELTPGECASCPVAAGARVDEVVVLTQGLAARVAPGRTVVRRAVVERPATGHAAAPGPTVAAVPGSAPRSRRALLGGSRDGAGPGVPGTGAAAERRGGKGALGARSVLLSVAPDAPLSRPLAGPGCTTCAACTRVCPMGALRWSETASTAVLEVDETACVGCAECVRVCPEDVLGVGCTLPAGARPSFGPSQVTRVRFTRCARCGERLRAGERGSCSRCSSRRGLLDDVWAHQEP